MNKAKVLIIDDDEDFSYFAKENLLAKGNYEVFTVKDSQESLQEINAITPDVILLDIRMPKIDGLEIAKEIRKINSQTKIIFITGFVGFELQKEASQYGICDYITKPASAADIIKAVEQALR